MILGGKTAIVSGSSRGMALTMAREMIPVVVFPASVDAGYITGAVIDVNGDRFMM
ncbi:MAG: hypothetical protein ABH969_07535 [Pseudomonadota bacterium]